MGFENDINAFWGTQWIENSKGIDITSHLSQFKFRYFLKPILDQLKPNAKVCEVGSGNCQWLSLIRSYRTDLDLYGIDLADSAKEFSKRFKIQHVSQDIRKIDLKDGYFDFTFSWGVIEHMEDSDLAFSQQYRLSKYFTIADVPCLRSLPAFTILRAIKRRKMTEYEAMIEFGKIFKPSDFVHLIRNTCSSKDQIRFINNYSVFPDRKLFRKNLGSFLDRLTPDSIRAKFGHNIGAIVKKKPMLKKVKKRASKYFYDWKLKTKPRQVFDLKTFQAQVRQEKPQHCFNKSIVLIHYDDISLMQGEEFYDYGANENGIWDLFTSFIHPLSSCKAHPLFYPQSYF